MGAEAMTLDESAYSDIIDSALVQEVTDAAHHGADIRPAWIGAHRPRTEIESLKQMAGGASTHYDFYLNFVRDYMERRGDMLDIGCGAGQSTAMLARYSNSALGVDQDQEVIIFAVKYNAGNRATFIHERFPEGVSGKFDYIFCVETLEHVPYENQLRFLARALGMLQEDGRMFITTPNESTPAPPHVGIWTKQWAADMAKHLGERVVRRGYFDNRNPGAGMQDKEASHRAWVLR